MSVTEYNNYWYVIGSAWLPKKVEEIVYSLWKHRVLRKAKGCLARPVLKEWYDFKVNKILPEDDEATIIEKEFNLSILANKKPYFFIYNYDKLKSEFMEYYKPNNQACMVKYKCEIHELYKKPNKTYREKEFLINYEFGCPVNVSPCLCNKIAWMVEDHFRTMERYKVEQFDKEKLKNPDVEYSTQLYNKVRDIKQKYDDAVQESIKSRIKEHGDAFDATEFKDMLLEGFKEQLVCVCCNEDVMCNVLVDVCYSTHTSKALLWDTCGDIIIRNLLAKNDNKLSFPKQSDEIEFTYKGLTFKMEVVEVETDSE